MIESKPCALCGKLMYRQSTHDNVNWARKTTCSLSCRKGWRIKRATGKVKEDDPDEPSEEKREEIAREIAKVRAWKLGGKLNLKED